MTLYCGSECFIIMLIIMGSILALIMFINICKSIRKLYLLYQESKKPFEVDNEIIDV